MFESAGTRAARLPWLFDPRYYCARDWSPIETENDLVADFAFWLEAERPEFFGILWGLLPEVISIRLFYVDVHFFFFQFDTITGQGRLAVRSIRQRDAGLRIVLPSRRMM